MLNWNEKGVCQHVIDVLRDDEIVLASSDTVLGLFAQLSEKSKKKLDILKKRNLKPYIILLESASLLSNFTDQHLEPSMQKIIDSYWPGPLTIIFKAKSTLPDWMISSQGTVAIRIPDHAGLQQVLHSLDGLFTTSANISDQSVPDRYDYVSCEILNQVQLVCCQQDVVYDGPASTIIDFSSGSINIVRVGALSVDSI